MHSVQSEAHVRDYITGSSDIGVTSKSSMAAITAFILDHNAIPKATPTFPESSSTAGWLETV